MERNTASLMERALGRLRGMARRDGRRAVELAEQVMIRASAVPQPGFGARAALNAAARTRLELLYHLEGRNGSAQLWQGLEKSSGQPLRAAFLADERAWKTGSPAYLQHLLFRPGDLEITDLGGLRMTAAPEVAQRLAERADLIIIERSRRFNWLPEVGACLLTPIWVRMGVRFTPGEPWEAVEARMQGHKNNIRRFQKYGFQLRSSRAEADFDLFYRRMHEPMVLQRHGDAVELEAEDSMRATFRSNGVLLFADTPDGQTVGGKLIYHYGRLAYVYAAGTLDGDPQWHDLGALSALSWYEIRWAYENGLSVLDCGSVRPFAADGNYLYKLRWGIHPIPDPWAPRTWLFWAPSTNPTALAWLRDHPLIEG